NQKILEETPAPNLPEKTRLALLSCAQKLGQAVNYRSAGTVEFLLDAKTFDFYFLEVNTRLQVEHGVTEEVYGIDLVEWMIRLARGETEFLQIPLEPKGHSIQARLYAEIPHRNYQPSSGRVTHWSLPKNLRIETHIALGSEVTPHYDPLLAKLIAHSPSRSEAIESLIQGLEQTEISGLETNAKLLSTILSHEQFQAGNPTTSLLPSIPYCPNAVEVIEPGTLTTLQDWPGRIGYWHVGVPPSGPMDYASFQLANLLVGNPPSAPALEITILGPTLLFLCDAIVAITGAEIEASIPLNQTVHLPANTTLRLGKILPPGCRAYLAVRGGFLVPKFLGSSSTFVLGQFGGHAGRPLRAGDILHIPPMDSPSHFQPKSISKKQAWSKHWYLRVIYGPHGAPDFFTENDISTLFSSTFTVHYNSNSTGIRLIGPKPQWARPDGGEAGLHPSNIHDNPYAIGTIDFTGDMPILLATDGPSLGGFVCPATVIQADRWILGQLQSGDTVQFLPISPDEADLAFQQTQQAITQLAYPEVPTPHETLTS
ncbi:MAG: 5-oxoprolinase/urea amidolyase family protein, partial [Chthoniobacterales bacterium]|nr:5-oxoprolinase/urea amidolyase family protein [Chthoniobacterales bacterium]